MKKLIQIVHDAEDKYTPEGVKPSALYIPDDAPEWELIEKLRGDTYPQPNPKIEEVYKLVKAGKTARQISKKMGYHIGTVRNLIRQHGWSQVIAKEPRANNRYDLYDARDKKLGRGTISQLSTKFGISKAVLYGHAGSYRKKIKRSKSFYLVKID